MSFMLSFKNSYNLTIFFEGLSHRRDLKLCARRRRRGVGILSHDAFYDFDRVPWTIFWIPALAYYPPG